MKIEYELTPTQVKKLASWFKTRPDAELIGTIGCRYTYKITPTSIGPLISIVDNLTKEELDLVEYELL